MKKKSNILILGSGFGGLYTALHLEKTLAHDLDIEITPVNRENFFLFTPMLHEMRKSLHPFGHTPLPPDNSIQIVKPLG
jgi:NADH dehydrogenase FAD-containing subunit